MTFPTPFAQAQVAVNGGSPVSGVGVTIPASATLALTGVNVTNWATALWEMYDVPPGFTAPAGWSTSAAGVIFYQGNSITPNPPAFTAPTLSGWGKWGIRLTVNDGQDPSGAFNAARMIDVSLALSMVSANGLRDIFWGEGSQFQSGALAEQWVQDLKANYRVIDTFMSTGGGGVTWANDLAGSSSTSQKVVSVTGSAGTLAVASTAANIQWASTTTSPTISQASTSGATGQTTTLAPQASTNANGTPGNLLVQLAAPTGSGSNAFFQVKDGTHLIASLGYNVSAGIGSALWVGTAAPSTSNYTLRADGSTFVYFNTPGTFGILSGGSSFLQYYDGAGHMMWGSSATSAAYEYFDLSATAKLHFGIAATSAAIQFDAATSDVATGTLTVQGQNALAAAVTNVNGGSIFLQSGTPATSSGLPGLFQFNIPGGGAGAGAFYGGYKFQYNGVDFVQIGQYSGSYGAIWFIDGGSANSGNWAFLGNASSTYFNGPGTDMFFGIAASYYMHMTTGGFFLGTNYTTAQYEFEFNTAAKLHFTNFASTSAAIVYDAPASDLATLNLTVQGQGAFASATTNKSGGHLLFVPGAQISGGVAGSIQLFSATSSFGGGGGVLGIANAQTTPSSVPSGGCVLWSDSNGLHYTGPSTSFMDVAMVGVAQGTKNSQQGKIYNYPGYARTTSTTSVTIATIPLATSGSTLSLFVMLSGRDVTGGTVGDSFSYWNVFTFKNVSGTVSASASTQATAMVSRDTSLSVIPGLVVSGTNILVQVAGITSVTIDWTANITAIIT